MILLCCAAGARECKAGCKVPLFQRVDDDDSEDPSTYGPEIQLAMRYDPKGARTMGIVPFSMTAISSELI